MLVHRRGGQISHPVEAVSVVRVASSGVMCGLST